MVNSNKNMFTKGWHEFSPSINNDPNINKIIEFYLWSCPSSNTVYNGRFFKDLGWKGGAKFKQLKNKLISCSASQIPFVFDTNDENIQLKKYKQDIKYTNQEVIILFRNPKDSHIEPLFRSIRNALAHGSFSTAKYKHEWYYFFENRDPSKKYRLCARIVLKSSTLIKWQQIVEGGPKSN